MRPRYFKSELLFAFTMISALAMGCGGAESSASKITSSPSASADTNANQSGSGSSGTAPSTNFSASYTLPSNKQGVNDARITESDADTEARYAVFRTIGTGLKIYNFWWSALEGSGVASSTSPMTCPSGYQLFPSNSDEKSRLGYNRYHCYSLSHLAIFDRILKKDLANGFQSAMVLWSSPEIYRYSGCAGAPWAGSTLKEGCVPRDDAMDDFEDYVNLVASRYSSSSSLGYIRHFIIWNENASGTWFDYSPMVPTRGVLSALQISRWIDKYADMMKRAHKAILRNTQSVMMYASTDMNWSTPSVSSSEVSHIGTKTLIDGLWSRLRADYSWSVAVHPYGNPAATPSSGQYGFSNLQSVVDYQKNWLSYYGKSSSFENPQAYLIASEQGWPQSDGIQKQAENICRAHQKALQVPNLVGVMHNYFHSHEPQESDPSASSGQGAFYGLIPYSIPANLNGIFGTATGAAYASTNPRIWGQYSDQYCCQAYSVGCPASAKNNAIGFVDGFTAQGSALYLNGWACSAGNTGSVTVHVYRGGASGTGTFMIAALANNPSAGSADQAAIDNLCGGSGVPHRFSIQIPAEMRALGAGQTVWVHALSLYGTNNNLLGNSGSFSIP